MHHEQQPLFSSPVNSWASLSARFGLKNAQGSRGGVDAISGSSSGRATASANEAETHLQRQQLDQAQRVLEQVALRSELPAHCVGLGGTLSWHAVESVALEPGLNVLERTRDARLNANAVLEVGPQGDCDVFGVWQQALEQWIASPACTAKSRAKSALAKMDKAIHSLPAAESMERRDWIDWPESRAAELTQSTVETLGMEPSSAHALSWKLQRLTLDGAKASAVGQAATQLVKDSLSNLTDSDTVHTKAQQLGEIWREASVQRASRARFAERNRDAKRMSGFALSAHWLEEQRLAQSENAQEEGASWNSASALRERAAQAFFDQHNVVLAKKMCGQLALPSAVETAKLTPSWQELYRQLGAILSESMAPMGFDAQAGMLSVQDSSSMRTSAPERVAEMAPPQPATETPQQKPILAASMEPAEAVRPARRPNMRR